MKIGTLTLKDPTVEVCGGVCDSPDACGIESCEFYDMTREGTEHFMKAMAHEQTLEGLMKKLSGAKPEKRSKPAIPKYTTHWADLDARVDELIENGFIGQAGSGPDGEPEYGFTAKGLEATDQIDFEKRTKLN